MKPYSLKEVEGARPYYDALKPFKYSAGVQAAVARATTHASIYDIETGGLDPRTPIYEMGFMKGLENPEFTHHLVNPTNIAGTAPGEITPWSQEKIDARTGLLSAAQQEGLSQKQAPHVAFAELAGRDVWVQNLRHESSFNYKRMGPEGFTSAAKQINLESRTPGNPTSGGLFPTPVKLKQQLNRAKHASNSKISSLGNYLDRWEDVFTKGFRPALEGERGNLTRFLDVMDLTKSVFAMAQKKGLMTQTGDLFTGTSVEAFLKGAYGRTESHKALEDAGAQGRMVSSYLGAAYAMQRGEALPPEMQRLLAHISATAPQQRQQNAVKNIVSTFQDLERYKASAARGKADPTLAGNAAPKTPAVHHTTLNVTAADGAESSIPWDINYSQKGTPFDSIEDVVADMAERAKSQHGNSVDYTQALNAAKEQYINPYRKAFAGHVEAGLDHTAAMTSALEGMAPQARIVEELAAKTPEIKAAAPEGWGARIKGLIKDNWKIGLIGAGAIYALNKISSRDDDYNYIEGMKHGGFAGDSRKGSTDFGSGWNPLRGLVRAGETFHEMLDSKGFRDSLANSIAKASDEVGGVGDFGQAGLRFGRFRDNYFPFIRKVGQIAPDEAELMSRVSETVAPDLYASSASHIDMELFLGKTLFDTSKNTLRKTKWEDIQSALHEVHKKGIVHGDAHLGNLMRTNEGRIGVIDFGRAVDVARLNDKVPYRAYAGGLAMSIVGPAKDAMRADFLRAREHLRYAGANIGSGNGAFTPLAIAKTGDMLSAVHNPQIEGLRHTLGASDTVARRHGLTDFGSGWQGMRIFAEDIVQESSEQYARMAARDAANKDKEGQRKEGYSFELPEALNTYFEGGNMAQMDVSDFAVEDADTVRLFMGNGAERTIRLAGIDAPEVKHENDDGSRIWPDQPFGQEASQMLQQIMNQQGRMKLLLDPGAEQSYGRNVGVLIGEDGTNINLEMVRRGGAAALPFGKRSTQLVSPTELKRAEADASAAQMGMWSEEAWQVNREAQINSKRKITNTSFSDLGRLFSDFKTSSVLMRMRNPDMEASEMEASGGRDDFNIHEGLKHGWSQSTRRANLKDFGSGYVLQDTIPKMPKQTYLTGKKLEQGQYIANSRIRLSMQKHTYMKHGRG